MRNSTQVKPISYLKANAAKVLARFILTNACAWECVATALATLPTLT